MIQSNKRDEKNIITGHGKLSTLEDLVAAIRRDMPSFSDVTAEYLKKIGVEKRSDGYYHRPDAILKLASISEPEIKAYSREIERSQSKQLNAEFPVLTLDPIKLLTRTAQIEGYNFAISLFSKSSRSFISKTRANFLIPTNGLKDYEQREKWMKKLAREYHKMGYLKKFSDISTVYLMVISSAKRFLMGKEHFNSKPYDSKYLFTDIFFDYLTLGDPFFSLSRTEADREEKMPTSNGLGFKFPFPPKKFLDDNIEMRLCVYSTTTKDEIKKIIDKSWPTIEKYKKRFPNRFSVQRIKDVNLLERNLKIFQLHSEGSTHTKIANGFKLNVTNVRKIVSDIKKEIYKTEKTEALR